VRAARLLRPDNAVRFLSADSGSVKAGIFTMSAASFLREGLMRVLELVVHR
jgi:hypothetical protein